MLVTHLNNSESLLLEISKIPSISGHSLHKGTPREIFVRNFLQDHLASTLAIGSGELIDANSEPGDQRAQHDIIIYKGSYPRLYLGGGIGAYLIESVVATVEIKSTLDEEDMIQVVKAASEAKELSPSTTAGMRRPLANYLLAYKGPAKMTTAFSWLRTAYNKAQLSDPIFATRDQRRFTASPALDGIFLLGKGFCLFENNVGFLNDWHLNQEPAATWSIVDCDRGSLLMLFACLLGLIEENVPNQLRPYPYYRSVAPEFKVARINGDCTDVEPVSLQRHNPVADRRESEIKP